jgi:hypothetical protein
MELKINQQNANEQEKNDCVAKEQMNTDMVSELSEESDKVKTYLDNILLISALKGYRVSQITNDYDFWRNHNISFNSDTDSFDIQFSIKRNNKIDSFEIKSKNRKLTDVLALLVADEKIKVIHSSLFFTYSHEGRMLMLENLHGFILNE